MHGNGRNPECGDIVSIHAVITYSSVIGSPKATQRSTYIYFLRVMRAESNGRGAAGDGVVGAAICPCSGNGLIGILAVELHGVFKVLCRKPQAAVRIKISLLMNQPAGNLFIS